MTKNPSSLTIRGPLDESAWARLEHVLSLLDRSIEGLQIHRREIAQRVVDHGTLTIGQLDRAQAIEVAFRACRSAIIGNPQILAQWGSLA